jgi:hypothetical protein
MYRYKYDQAYVIRGSDIDVFRYDDANSLSFKTEISGISSQDGTLLQPEKVTSCQKSVHLMLVILTED